MKKYELLEIKFERHLLNPKEFFLGLGKDHEMGKIMDEDEVGEENEEVRTMINPIISWIS